MCVLAVMGMAFFSWLGTWQLHRAEEKKQLLSHEAALKMRAPRAWVDDVTPLEAFERVYFQGQFLPDIFFLDNQYHAHQIGYHVLSPVQMQTGHIVMVDRGWVPAGVTREQLPHVDIPEDGIRLSGSVYKPRGIPWVLGPGLEIRQEHQVVLEVLDFKLVSQILHKPVDPFIIRLDDESPAGYVRDWVTVVMLPVRHIGYAVQWFALAGVVLIVFIGLNLKKNERL
jgi:surfeit locus 1 family protein